MVKRIVLLLVTLALAFVPMVIIINGIEALISFRSIGSELNILTLSVLFWGLMPLYFGSAKNVKLLKKTILLCLLTPILVSIYCILVEPFFGGETVLEALGRCVLLPFASWNLSKKIQSSEYD